LIERCASPRQCRQKCVNNGQVSGGNHSAGNPPTVRRRRGRAPKPPDTPPRPDEQVNLTDPDSRLMRKSKRHEYRQAYNAQAVVDADGS
jgi:hypothetical protein